MSEMPERVWLTCPRSKVLRQIVPVQYDHDEADTQYVRADIHDTLVKAAELRGYQRGLIDSHNDALESVDAMNRGWQESTFRSSTDDRVDESPAAPDPHEYIAPRSGCQHVLADYGGGAIVMCARPADHPIHSPDALSGADIAEEGDEEGDR